MAQGKIDECPAFFAGALILDEPGIRAISARRIAVCPPWIGPTEILVTSSEVRRYEFIGRIGAVIAAMMLSCGVLVVQMRLRQAEGLLRSVVSGKTATGLRIARGLDVLPFVHVIPS
jgi:hypothetical protein